MEASRRPQIADRRPQGHSYIRRVDQAWVAALLVLHLLLVANLSRRYSPTFDEVGYFPAGLAHWQFGRFDLYKVNPPLIRLVATAPAFLAGFVGSWDHYPSVATFRSEFLIGRQWFKDDSLQLQSWLVFGRHMCLPFTMLGAIVCWCWAREMYGRAAAYIALLLWCFDPNVLAHASLMTPDLPAAGLAVFGCYLFVHYLARRSIGTVFLLGAVLGASLLTKFTLLTLGPTWCLVCLMRRRQERALLSLVAVLAVSVYVVNLGYGFEGTLKPLQERKFVSALLGPQPPDSARRVAGNRFAGQMAGALPVPFPANFVEGIDAQKAEFERGKPSYMCGVWSPRGWWWYYLYAFAIKLPIGTLVLFGIGLVQQLRDLWLSRQIPTQWPSLVTLWLVPLCILALVSSQTGFSHHSRYALPCLPFLFISASYAGVFITRGGLMGLLVTYSIVLSLSSSLWAYPHSLSYFNEVIGGPLNGHKHLLNSNLDWGQDLLYLKAWLASHPEARPIYVAYDVRSLPVETLLRLPTSRPVSTRNLEDVSRGGAPGRFPAGMPPGWYAISANELYDQEGEFSCFTGLTPLGRCGYSLWLYHLPDVDAGRPLETGGRPASAQAGASAPRHRFARQQSRLGPGSPLRPALPGQTPRRATDPGAYFGRFAPQALRRRKKAVPASPRCKSSGGEILEAERWRSVRLVRRRTLHKSMRKVSQTYS